jgi:uncharacterized protein (TIGR02391 family)
MTNALYSAIPDPSLLLSLEPDELGRKILLLIQDRIDAHFHLNNLVLEFVTPTDRVRGTIGYPEEFRNAISNAIAEAISWLKNQGLLYEIPQYQGCFAISRRGKEIKSEADFYHAQLVKLLPREILHFSLQDSIRMSFVRGDFEVAVFHAMKQVEIAVRQASGFQESDHGVPMIRRAFHKDNGPLTDQSSDEGEREALQHLFAGAIGSYKNPHSHRNVPLDDPIEVVEILFLANHLLRIVDTRLQRNAAK